MLFAGLGGSCGVKSSDEVAFSELDPLDFVIRRGKTGSTKGSDGTRRVDERAGTGGGGGDVSGEPVLVACAREGP